MIAEFNIKASVNLCCRADTTTETLIILLSKDNLIFYKCLIFHVIKIITNFVALIGHQ